MVPHILILDRNPSAAQMTRSLVRRILPTAAIQLIAPPRPIPEPAQAALIDLLILDPAGVDSMMLGQIVALQARHPELVVVVITAEPPARRMHQLQGLQVTLVLEKGDPPAVLLDKLGALLRWNYSPIGENR